MSVTSDVHPEATNVRKHTADVLSEIDLTLLECRGISKEDIVAVHNILPSVYNKDHKYTTIGKRYVEYKQTEQTDEQKQVTAEANADALKGRTAAPAPDKISNNKGTVKRMVACPDCGSHFEVNSMYP
jgi:hypothetical protein